jgi:Fe2+ transport system protein FeoA
MLTLDTLASGQWGTIVNLDGDDGITRRLMELGFLPGTRVEVIGFAPLGDPVAVFVRGSRMAIRLRDARRIRVSPMTAS